LRCPASGQECRKAGNDADVTVAGLLRKPAHRHGLDETLAQHTACRGRDRLVHGWLLLVEGSHHVQSRPPVGSIQSLHTGQRNHRLQKTKKGQGLVPDPLRAGAVGAKGQGPAGPCGSRAELWPCLPGVIVIPVGIIRTRATTSPQVSPPRSGFVLRPLAPTLAVSAFGHAELRRACALNRHTRVRSGEWVSIHQALCLGHSWCKTVAAHDFCF
jgi:hypothetical protein